MSKKLTVAIFSFVASGAVALTSLPVMAQDAAPAAPPPTKSTIANTKAAPKPTGGAMKGGAMKGGAMKGGAMKGGAMKSGTMKKK